MNNPDHISESLKTTFWVFGFWVFVFYLNSLIRLRDPEFFLLWIRDGKKRIRDKHPGSATLFPG
jgi:hypothetical protein